MKIVMALRCPTEHDHVSEDGLPIKARGISALSQLLSRHRCPACPGHTLETGLTVVAGQDHDTGFCSCCGATWLPGTPVRLLTAGRLFGAEFATRQGISS
ncbi:hypothetical protein [Nocardia brasiliensis]|uniref:hypothetical protein n=1 Tax=Nocardia brasiliensis TaxID=37326 RepID=UPI0024550918|nr:hypothetical protein [Nocardia brasiliensis]